MTERNAPIRVYADTSVFGGTFDEEFRLPSLRFFEQVEGGIFSLVTSDVVRREVSDAPTPVQELFRAMAHDADIVEITDDAIGLRDAYVRAEIITKRYLPDALHVALATISGCTMIVSWNFKHIVNYRNIPRYNAVNTLMGHGTIAIYSPLEVLQHET